MATGWRLLKPILCDLCEELAVWMHPEGGFRCHRCPRPQSTGAPPARPAGDKEGV